MKPENSLTNYKSNLFKRLIVILIFISIIIFTYFKQKNLKPNVDENLKLSQKYKNAQIITTDYANFKTPSVPIRKKTMIKVTFIPPAKPSVIWLGLYLGGDQLKYILINQPSLNKIKWQYISNREYTLFQKTFVYDNIENFLNNPPRIGSIQADPQIIQQNEELKKIAKELEFDINFDKTDFILTTYKPHHIENQFHVFETIIDATNAAITDNKLSWSFYNKGVSKNNPFILKGVDINFAQPAKIDYKN